MNIKVFLNTLVNSGKVLIKEFVFWPVLAVCVIMLIILIRDFSKRKTESLKFFRLPALAKTKKIFKHYGAAFAFCNCAQRHIIQPNRRLPYHPPACISLGWVESFCERFKPYLEHNCLYAAWHSNILLCKKCARHKNAKSCLHFDKHACGICNIAFY